MASPTVAPQTSAEVAASKPVLGTLNPTVSVLPLRLPGAPVYKTSSDPRIAQIKAKLARFPTFAGYRRLARLYVQLGMYREAASTYRTEAAMYRRKGLSDAAQIEERKAAHYETRMQLFREREAVEARTGTEYSGASLEPGYGCYLGAFIDRDDRLKQTFRGESWQTYRYPHEFATLVGKRHATYFTYVQYGKGFPRRWL